MRDTGSTLAESRDCPTAFVGLALQVVERLAARRTGGVEKLRSEVLERMLDTARAPAPGSVGRMVADFRRAKISSEQVVDHYIPATARALGKGWEDDTLSFAEVTIGVVWLQEMLHELQAEWTADEVNPESTSAVLVILPPGEQHTLGAMVAAAEIRRKGVSVCIRIAPGLSDLSILLDHRRFDAVMVSIGSADRIEVCTKMVKTLKQITKGAINVAVGGAIFDSSKEALDAIGADLVTNDVAKVILEFGLDGRDAGSRLTLKQ